MVYCAGRLIENLKLFYKSNRPHFLWVYRHDNPLGMLEEHSKSLSIKRFCLMIYKLFSCSPNNLRGLSCRLTHRKCGLLLKYTHGQTDFTRNWPIHGTCFVFFRYWWNCSSSVESDVSIWCLGIKLLSITESIFTNKYGQNYFGGIYSWTSI